MASLPLRTTPIDPFASYPEVRRLHCPTRQQWEDHLRQDGGPVLITGALEGLPALARWTPEYLKANAGQRRVGLEYSIRPIYRPDPRLNFGKYIRRHLPFAECIDAVTASRPGGLYQYISTVSVGRELPELLPDLAPPAFTGRMPFQDFVMFFGGPQTGSQMHYDPTQGLMAVFKGSKTAVLFAPGRLRQMRARSALYPLCHFSELDMTRPGPVSRAGLPQGVRCTVKAGEMLFIPLNWWHFIRNQEQTLGVTFVYGAPLAAWARWRQVRGPLRSTVDRHLQRWPKLYQWVGEKLQNRAFERTKREGKQVSPG